MRFSTLCRRLVVVSGFVVVGGLFGAGPSQAVTTVAATGARYFVAAPSCTVTWNGPDGGSWATAANWLPAAAPTSVDQVCLNGATLTVPAATDAVVADLNADNSSLTIAGTLKVDTHLSAAGATLTGPGSLTIVGGLPTTFAGTAFAGGVTVVNQGSLTVESVYGNCPTDDGIFGFWGACLTGGSVLQNAGTLTIKDDADIRDFYDTNAGGGLVNDSGAVVTTNAAGTGRAWVEVTNNGTITVPDGARLTIDRLAATAAGSITGAVTVNAVSVPGASAITANGLTIAGPVTGTGTLTLAPGSKASLAGGSLEGGVKVVNQGSLRVDSVYGTCTTDNGPFDFWGACLTGGSVLENAGTLTINDDASIYDGEGTNVGAGVVNDVGAVVRTNAAGTGRMKVDVTNNGRIIVPAGAALTIDRLTATASGSITGAVTVNAVSVPGASLMRTNGLTISGPVSGAGTLTLSVGSKVSLAGGSLVGGVKVVNRGSLAVASVYGDCPTDGGMYYFWGACLTGGSVLENAGTLTVNDDARIYDGEGTNAGGGLVNDAGAVVTTNAAGRGRIQVVVTNSGTIAAPSGATLEVDSLTTTVSGAIRGAVTVNAVSVPVPSAIAANGLTISGPVTGAGTLTLPTGSRASLAGGSLVGGVKVVNQGSLTVASVYGNCPTDSGTYDFWGACLTGGSVLENAGTLTVNDDTEVIDGAGTNGGGGVVNNAGAVVRTYSGHARILPDFTNNGRVVVPAGASLMLDNVKNLVSGVLTGGTWSADGTLLLWDDVTTNNATITLGSAGRVDNVNGPSALRGLAENQGSLTTSTSLTTTEALANSGTVTVRAGALQAVSYTQSAGSTTVNAGASLKAGQYCTGTQTFTSGALRAAGTLCGKVTASGSVTPGPTAAQLSVTGKFTATPTTSTSVVVSLSGTKVSAGRMTATGVIALNGSLTVSQLAGYDPPIGTTVTVATGSNRTGTFSSVSSPGLTGKKWVASYTPKTAVLTMTAD